MIHLLFLFCLLLILLAYFKVADEYNIIDKPNKRSSHTKVAIRGGGILFPISIVLWSIVSGVFNPFIIGLVLISVVSFIDDCKPLSNKIRTAIHFLSIGLLLYQFGFSEFSYLSWAFGLLFIGGWINAYNFMDGINGITVLYSLSVLSVCYYLNLRYYFVPPLFINYTLMGLLVFGFYNVRKKAKTFAGDVGSISMAFILAFIILSLLLKSANWHYILLVSIYGIDTLVTIVERLRKKENIFKAHRSHLYQYLANEAKWPHVRVSVLYAVLQLMLNVILIYYIIPLNSHSAAVTFLLLQGGIYLCSKNLLLQQLKK
jgi:UDP-GlcNAc:undecaprenyl-phosphate/decaprenyl-phosphate GlcNAc-1-phosphate transferase